MGNVCNCCSKESPDPERQPLLPQEDRFASAPSQATFNKIVDVCAALTENKLPTQQQISKIIYILLSSDFIKHAELDTARGILSQRGKLVIHDVAEVLRAVSQLGNEVNAENSVQDLIFHAKKAHGHSVSATAEVNDHLTGGVRSAASNLPDEQEVREDTEEAFNSVVTLIRLVFTSPTFQSLLSEAILLARDICADMAADVSQAARIVAEGAENVEETLKPTDTEKDRLQAHPDEVTGVPPVEEMREKQKETVQEAKDLASHTAEEAKAAWMKAKGEGDPERIKGAMIDRITQMVHQVQANPEYQRSISTLISIIQKHANKVVDTIAEATEATKSGVEAQIAESKSTARLEVEKDPHTDKAIADAKILLERLSSKPSLVNSIGDRLRDLAQQLSQDAAPPDAAGDEQLNDIQKWTRSFRNWGSQALRNPSYVTTDQFRQDLGELYDDWLKILRAEGPEEKKLQSQLGELLNEVQELVDSVSNDRSVRRLLAAIAKLTMDTAYIASISSLDLVGVAQLETQRIAKEAKEEIRRDIVGFVLPRLIQAIKVLPLPRMEYASPQVDIVLDNLNLNSPSFLPDHFKLTNWSDLHFIGPDAAYERGSYSATQKHITSATTVPSLTISQAHTRTSIHIDGLRISASDIAYYVNYKGPACLGWEDWGLISIDIGRRGKVGEGLKLDIELEMVDRDVDIQTASQETPASSTRVVPEPSSSEDGQASKPSFFKVVDVKVDVPGLTFTIRKSRHWIFNSLFLQPLLEPTVREAIYIIARQQIRNGLEEVDRKLASASESAKHRTGQKPSLFDYLYELVYGDITPDAEEEEESTEPEVSNGIPPPQKTTTVGLQGVVMRSHQPATRPEEDSILAVGVGEQVLRDVPLPDPSGSSKNVRNIEDVGPALANEGRQAVEDLAQAGEEAVDTAVEVVEEVEEVRETVKDELAVARVRYKDRKKVERRKKGWKSPAFNF